MDLLGMTSGAVGMVNPRVPLVVQVSRGSTKNDAFEPVPLYEPPITLMGQVQPLEWRDIQMIDGLNLQGTRRKIYLFGAFEGIVRVDRKGGDLITDPKGNIWLVAVVAEHWENQWCAVIATLQNESGC